MGRTRQTPTVSIRAETSDQSAESPMKERPMEKISVSGIGLAKQRLRIQGKRV